jgi:hypothetical protein
MDDNAAAAINDLSGLKSLSLVVAGLVISA